MLDDRVCEDVAAAEIIPSDYYYFSHCVALYRQTEQIVRSVIHARPHLFPSSTICSGWDRRHWGPGGDVLWGAVSSTGWMLFLWESDFTECLLRWRLWLMSFVSVQVKGIKIFPPVGSRGWVRVTELNHTSQSLIARADSRRKAPQLLVLQNHMTGVETHGGMCPLSNSGPIHRYLVSTYSTGCWVDVSWASSCSAFIPGSSGNNKTYSNSSKWVFCRWERSNIPALTHMSGIRLISDGGVM